MLNTSPYKSQQVKPISLSPYYQLNTLQNPYYYQQGVSGVQITQLHAQKNSQSKQLNQDEKEDEKIEDYNNPTSIIKANILNNRPMVFSNYQHFDFALIFEEQLKIVNSHQEYIQKIHTLRLDLPQIFNISERLLQTKDEILKKQFTNSRKVYTQAIKPKTAEMINLKIKLQKLIENQNNLSNMPLNPYYKQLDVKEETKQSQTFETQYNQTYQEMNTIEQKIAEILTSIKQYQAQYQILKDETLLKEQQKVWETEKQVIVQFLEKTITQSVINLVKLHQSQIHLIKFDIQQNNNQSSNGKQHTIQALLYSEGGIIQFYDMLSTIEGELQSLEQIKQKSENLDLQLAQIKIKFIEFEDFYSQIVVLNDEIKKHKKKVKAIQNSPIKPILQQYQNKNRKKCLHQIRKLYSETKQLVFEGQLILKFDFKSKLKQFQELQLTSDLSKIVSLIDDYESLYIQNFYQVPFEDMQLLIQIISKLEKQYAETNQIRLDIKKLFGSIRFIGYRAYIIETIKPQFIIEFKNIHDRIAIILSYKFQNEEVLSRAREALEIVYPDFGWNESFEVETNRLWLLQDKQSQVSNTYNEFKSQDLATSYKFMRQLEQSLEEINRGVECLQQYLVVKEGLENQRIDLFQWPEVELQEISVKHLKFTKLIEETNEKVRAIILLKQLNLFNKLQEILSRYDNDSQEKLKCLYLEVQKIEHSTLLKRQLKILEDFLKVCIDHFIDDIDLKFCQTNTYQELEDELGGTTKLSELRFQNEQRQGDQELRQQLHDLMSNFMRQKLSRDFSNLFQLKLIQSQEGTSNFDPYKLQFRTDLLHPINRVDINQNYFCIQEKQKLETIIDQPELRMIFFEFRKLLNQTTKIMSESQELQEDQELILELITAFESQLTLKINLTNLEPMKKFHSDFKDWKLSLYQDVLPLGIVLGNEYDTYLESCRRRISIITQGTIVAIEKNDENIVLEKILFNVNGNILNLELLIDQCYYKDYKSIVISKIQSLAVLESDLVLYVNDRQLLRGQQVLL